MSISSSLFVLGIETATPNGGVALAEIGGGIIAIHGWHSATGFSRRLMPAIDALLRESGAEQRQIAAIAATHGPGSFTGVRVGVVTAKTLAHALGIPLYLYSTLEMCAARWPQPGAAIGVLLDARRGEIYSGFYARADATGLETLREERVEPTGAALDNALRIAEQGETEIWFTGDAVAKRSAEIETAMGRFARFVSPPLNLPAPDVVAVRGAVDLARGAAPTNPFDAAPVYLRASDAERALKSVPT